MSEDALWDQGSVFRPSYSATWLTCAGSLRPSMYAADSAGWEAAEGTVFHSLMAEWQTSGKRPDHWLGTTIRIEKEDGSTYFDITVDQPMFDHGLECLAYIEFLAGREIYVERKVDISSITPIAGQKGTADVIGVDTGHLDVIDWKYGKGVKVYAEWNPQLLCYGWGAFVEFDPIYEFHTIRLHIAQPRLNNWQTFTITRAELIEWAAWAKARAAEAWKPGAPRVASPKGCQWCKVRVDCTALEAARQRLIDDTPFDVEDEPGSPITEDQMKAVVAMNSPPRDPPAPATLPTAQLARIRRYRGLMESWLKEVDAELLRRAEAGEEVAGWKVVEGRSFRRFEDETVAAERLTVFGLGEDELFKRSMVSPAQVEKLLRAIGVRGRLLKLYMRTLTVKPPGKPTLAPTGDERLALPELIDDEFDVVDRDPAAL